MSRSIQSPTETDSGSETYITLLDLPSPRDSTPSAPIGPPFSIASFAFPVPRRTRASANQERRTDLQRPDPAHHFRWVVFCPSCGARQYVFLNSFGMIQNGYIARAELLLKLHLNCEHSSFYYSMYKDFLREPWAPPV